MPELGALAGKGAEAELTYCRWIKRLALCKRRTRKSYRIKALDEVLRERRTRKEAKIIHAAKQAGVIVPILYHADVQRKEIIISYIKGWLLSACLPKLSAGARRRALTQAGRQLALLHNAGIVHGDSTTTNMIWDGRRLIFIDFGLSEFSDAVEQKATDLLLLKKSLHEDDWQIANKAYAQASKQWPTIEKRLRAIEARGRYVVRAMVERKE